MRITMFLLAAAAPATAAAQTCYVDVYNTAPSSLVALAAAPAGSSLFRTMNIGGRAVAGGGDSITIAFDLADGGCRRDLRLTFADGRRIDQADFDAQMSAIRLANDGGKALGIAAPRVAVAGLNPHAGEGGLFGDEEIRIIRPAIETARAEGIDASGPWPGDTVYMQARKGRFDVVVAQYHDQGLIPVKYLGLEKGVNITLGLPFVRTSPDHGTAFDIAGQGTADPTSLETAIAYARRLVAAQTRTKEHGRLV